MENLWQTVHSSICSLTFLDNGDRIASGTGFRVKDMLVTNNHVIQVPSATHVEILFVGSDGNTPTKKITITKSDFRSNLIDGSPKHKWDYAILDLDNEKLKEIPPLSLAQADNVNIGSRIVLLGFHFDKSNLSIHRGILSSRFERSGVNYLQLDASINHGNSGGPLILPETGDVVGIITRKATGLTQQFDDLITSFQKNHQALQQAQSMMSLGGVDPAEALAVSQAQMEQVAKEIQRSANVGIGYAYEIRRIRESIEKLT